MKAHGSWVNFRSTAINGATDSEQIPSAFSLLLKTCRSRYLGRSEELALMSAIARSRAGPTRGQAHGYKVLSFGRITANVMFSRLCVCLCGSWGWEDLGRIETEGQQSRSSSHETTDSLRPSNQHGSLMAPHVTQLKVWNTTHTHTHGNCYASTGGNY